MIIFEPHKNHFRSAIRGLLESQANQKYTYILSAAASALVFSLMALTWGLETSFIAFDFLGKEWFENTDGLYLRIFSITLSLILIMPILVTGLRLMLLLLKVIGAVDRVEFIPSPRTCQRKIMPTLKILLNISFLFSAFAAFFIILFQDRLWPLTDFSILYWLIILAVVFTGMSGVIYPVFIVRKKITAIKERRLDAITERVIALTENDDIDSLKTIIELYRLEEQLEFNNKIDSLFISWKYFTSFLLSIVFPLALAIVQIYIQDYLIST